MAEVAIMKKSKLSVRLRSSRESAGLSQIDAAKKLEISNGTLSGYERDYRDPDTRTLEKMADLYEVSVDYLLGRSDIKKEENKEDKMFAYGGFDDMSEKEMQHLWEYAEIMRERRKKMEKLYEDDDSD